MWTEILTADGIVPEVWEAECNEEYLRQLFWSRWSGTGMNAVIQLKEDLTKKKGDAINIAMRSRLRGGRVTGAGKISGNEGSISFANQRITVDVDNLAGREENVNMTEQRAAFGVLEKLKAAIIDERAQVTEDRITTMLTDTTLGRVRGGYLYGAADSNYNATHATALQAVDNTDDQLTLSAIDMMKRKATVTSGSSSNRQRKVRPYKTSMGNGAVMETYVFVGQTLCVRDLVKNDAAFRQPHLLLPPTSNPNSPLYTGSWFKGGFNGVLIYEFEGMPLISSTIQVGHCLLLGAQAGAIVWAQHGKMQEEDTNYGNTFGLNHQEINGLSKIVYDWNTVDGSANEDQGVINGFFAAVGD